MKNRHKNQSTALLLLTAILGALPVHADPSTHKAAAKLELSQKHSKLETSLGELAVTEYYRGDSLVLRKTVPPDESLNTVHYIIHNGFEVMIYKLGPIGAEFIGAGVIRDMVKPDYTIKLVGDKEGRIRRIMLYSPDFTKTYDAFWLKNHELIPWSAEELEGWRKVRRENPNKVDADDAKAQVMSAARIIHDNKTPQAPTTPAK